MKKANYQQREGLQLFNLDFSQPKKTQNLDLPTFAFDKNCYSHCSLFSMIHKSA